MSCPKVSDPPGRDVPIPVKPVLHAVLEGNAAQMAAGEAAVHAGVVKHAMQQASVCTQEQGIPAANVLQHVEVCRAAARAAAACANTNAVCAGEKNNYYPAEKAIFQS
jgi:hypothetical protein